MSYVARKHTICIQFAPRYPPVEMSIVIEKDSANLSPMQMTNSSRQKREEGGGGVGSRVLRSESLEQGDSEHQYRYRPVSTLYSPADGSPRDPGRETGGGGAEV